MLLLKRILDCKSKKKVNSVLEFFAFIVPCTSQIRAALCVTSRSCQVVLVLCCGSQHSSSGRAGSYSVWLACGGVGGFFCIFGGQASAMFRRATGMQRIQSKAGNTTWKVWVMGRSSVPHLVSLCLQLSHLVLDHSVLLLVHVTVQGQLLHLQAQALLLIQELNAITHTSHQSVILGYY